ncbi:calcium-binding protein [Benzoatithermus flavus]|uniref:Calcium-binding protein n=1 Tax=Benzoatithermus flavus TaxID=3108223 RepID=A0ABU8XZ83_9PROT
MALFLGTTGDDDIVGTFGADQIYGDYGNDLLWGDNGSDTIRGSFGNDLLNGGTGADCLRSDQGNDVLVGGEDGSRDILIGLYGRDWLDGGAGNDTLDGGVGADTLIGGDGADVFVYQSIKDSPATGGDFIQDFDPSQDQIDLSNVRTGTGQDFVFIGQTSFTGLGQVAVEYTADGLTHVNVNTSWAAGSEMVITLQGWVPLGESNFILHGGDQFAPVRDENFLSTEGDDWFFGEGGNDYAFGGAGNDELHGGPGEDMLRGGDGNDILVGEQGNDLYYGGLGRDSFVFDGNFGHDLVQDFHHEDKLVIAPDAFGNHRTFEGLTITQESDGALIDTGDGNQILLADFNAADLSQRDFIFT